MAWTEDPDVAPHPSHSPAVILIVVSNDREREAVLAHVRRRYREDYDIHAEGSTTAALGRLKNLRDDGRGLAIMLADCQLSDGNGIELLSQAQVFHPDAMRALLVSRSGSYGADPALADEYARAVTLGEVHRIVLGPGGEMDEQFNLAVQELVYEWARQHRPRFEVIRIVGDRWSEATGVSYRRIGIESVDAFVGRGVFYGAAMTEAPAMRGEEVFVVGGANSAGQAALHISRFAAKVTILIRGSSLAQGMSDYLVREIEASPNIVLRLNHEVADARGDQRLRSLIVKDRLGGTTEEVPAMAVFILIGAAPRTAWLPPAVERDERGFILTGSRLSSTGADGKQLAFGTSLAGVFAVGDVRASAAQRVASAVGEGSVAIRDVHEYLEQLHDT